MPGADAPPEWRRGRGAVLRLVSLLFSLGLLAAPARAQHFTGEAWPEADRLFHADPRWLGSDAAYSVPLGPETVLWLFGDSWIAPPGAHQRRDATLVSNTLAVQHGADPSRATISFHWGRGPGERPTAFFVPPGGERLWPAHGIRLGPRLLLLFLIVAPSADPLGFRIAGSAAVLVANPDDDPGVWRVRWLPLPPFRGQVALGGGGLLADAEFVYAYGAEERSGRHAAFLARWRRTDAEAGDLLGPEWWCGDAGWRLNPGAETPPVATFEDAQTEFSVHRDSAAGGYIEVQSLGFGAAPIGLRRAPALTGPWSPVDTIYRPPELDREQILVYAAKAHPELRGGDLVLTYATNLPFALQRSDSTVYYPRFVRLSRE